MCAGLGAGGPVALSVDATLFVSPTSSVNANPSISAAVAPLVLGLILDYTGLNF
jgi:hypothetical protein